MLDLEAPGMQGYPTHPSANFVDSTNDATTYTANRCKRNATYLVVCVHVATMQQYC